jgi:hypothetical protein
MVLLLLASLSVVYWLSFDTEPRGDTGTDLAPGSTSRYYYLSSSGMDLSRDPPRLAVVRQELVDGKELVRFRLEAPKHKGVTAMSAGIIAYADGRGWNLPWGETGAPSFDVRAGREQEFQVPTPTQAVWTLRISLQGPGKVALSELGIRLRICWQRRSLRYLRTPLSFNSAGLLESAPITNAIRAPVVAGDF